MEFAQDAIEHMIKLNETVNKIIHLPILTRRQAEELVREIYKQGYEDGQNVYKKSIYVKNTPTKIK